MRRLARGVAGDRLIDAVNERRNTWRTLRARDRQPLVDSILPAFAARGGNILWVGCRRYTQDYPARLEAGGGVCWTTDIDPSAEAFGAPGRHRTGDLCQAPFLFDDVAFDVILCNGVFGYGVDSPQMQRSAVAAMAEICNPGALLLLGWNTDKIDDPVASGATAPAFSPCAAMGLSQRLAVPGTTHVYDLFRHESAPHG